MITHQLVGVLLKVVLAFVLGQPVPRHHQPDVSRRTARHSYGLSIGIAYLITKRNERLLGDDESDDDWTDDDRTDDDPDQMTCGRSDSPGPTPALAVLRQPQESGSQSNPLPE